MADAWRDMAGFCVPYVLEQCTAGLAQNVLLTGTESADTSKAAKLRMQATPRPQSAHPFRGSPIASDCVASQRRLGGIDARVRVCVCARARA